MISNAELFDSCVGKLLLFLRPLLAFLHILFHSYRFLNRVKRYGMCPRILCSPRAPLIFIVAQLLEIVTDGWNHRSAKILRLPRP